jgi:DNA-binding LacI/PurR family transcriptional regulator
MSRLSPVARRPAEPEAGQGQRPPGSVAAIERLQGVTETLAHAGVSPAGAIGCVDWQPELGFAAVKKLLSRGARPCALICFNDRLAIGAHNALADAGLVIPTDVAVMSVDDDLGSAAADHDRHPPLRTRAEVDRDPS